MFDLIIGTEIMQKWGAVLGFETKMVKIDGTSLPMRHIKTLQDQDLCLQAIANSYPSYISRYKPRAIEETTKHVVEILDAKYKPAHLAEVVSNNCPCLNCDQQKRLLDLLYEFESLFDGTLDD